MQVNKWADVLYRFACKSLGSRAAAQDAVQNAYESLWKNKERVEEGSAKAWLCKVVYRNGVDEYRRQSKLGNAAILESDDQEDAGKKGGSFLKKELDAALQKLDESSRMLVLLKDYEGYSYAEIAEITGLNVQQVKTYLHRSRKRLQHLLGKLENIL